jgi:nucleotide-binding universal stress UspA family protein
METASRAEFDRIGREELAGFDAVEFIVVRGVPHEEVLRYAKDNAVDLIVVGTHGRAGLDRMFFGSTASRWCVTLRAPC